MAIKANPTAIGSFIVGAVLIVFGAIIFFGSGDFFTKKEGFVLYFDGSLQGLKVGAPVSMKGVQIGEVKSISIDIYANGQLDALTQVIIEINTNNFHHVNKKGAKISPKDLIDDGLRAQLKMQSLLTGLLYIETDFFPRTPVNLKHLEFSTLPELPTMATELEQLIAQLERMNWEKVANNIGGLVEGLNAFVNDTQWVQLPANINSTLASAKQLMETMGHELTDLNTVMMPLITNANDLVKMLDQTLPPTIDQVHTMMVALNDTAAKLDEVADDAQFLLSDRSPLLYQLNTTIEQVGDAAYQLSALAHMLEARPEALIRGK